MPVPDYKITDQSSFVQVTEGSRQIAGLYFFQVLDALVGLAYMISADFRRRPQLYRGLGAPAIVPTLAALYVQYGTEINFLSKPQRREIYLPIFGNVKSDSFPRLRDKLIHTATTFVETADLPGLPMLRESVRTSHRLFKDYLLGLDGDSVKFSVGALSELNQNTCYPILRHQGVAFVFGVAKLVGVEYPFATDSAEDLLVEQAFKQLTGSNAITRERIRSLQEVALRGAEAIATAIDFEEADVTQTEADLDLLIRKLYIWGTALASLANGMTAWQSLALGARASVSQPSATPATAPSLARLAPVFAAVKVK